MMADETPQQVKKKAFATPGAWAEARTLVRTHRNRLVLGMGLMLISRGAGFVVPAMSAYVVDDVIGNGQSDLLVWLALGAAAATLVQASTGFALSQVLGVAAQRAITEMRKRVQRHVTRLPVSYFDSTKTGVLISRVMTDAEGIRNLVGTGLAQLVGGFLTATVGLAALFYLNWRLTVVTLSILVLFGLVMTTMFKKLR
ncbi:MAG: ABC transporter ATP-binding protein, partial [bacterium]